jgi:enoyl-CoA hydratase/carnithine racemase
MAAPAAALTAAAGLGLHVDGSRATVTFDLPAGEDYATTGRLPPVAGALAAVGRSLTGDIRVIVIRGDVWSLSTGLHELTAASAEVAERLVADWQAGFGWLSARADLISVAAVAGPASGAGLQLALSCDLRVLTEDACLALSEPRSGLVPGLGVTAALVGLVGYPTALDMCLTGRRLSAAEALSAGAVQRVVPALELDRAVEDLVAAILTTPRDAAVETKALLRGAVGRGRGEQLAAERAALARCLAAGAGALD